MHRLSRQVPPSQRAVYKIQRPSRVIVSLSQLTTASARNAVKTYGQAFRIEECEWLPRSVVKNQFQPVEYSVARFITEQDRPECALGAMIAEQRNGVANETLSNETF